MIGMFPSPLGLILLKNKRVSQLACKELDESPSKEEQSGFNSGMDTRLLSGAEGASHQPSDVGVGE